MIDIVKETEHAGVEGKLLGQRVAAPKTYTPSILVAVPRIENRIAYGITDADFSGHDRWNCYECSFLYANGAPHYLGVVIAYSSKSWAIVESKSLKLYLNSFNMTNMGPTLSIAKQNFIDTIKNDLSELLKAMIEVETFNAVSDIVRVGDDFLYLESLVNPEVLEFKHFKEAPEVLEADPGGYKSIDVSSSLLRSNCKVTHQPDCGTIHISIRGKKVPTYESLLKYIVSFRDENHFHEEVCEMVFKRLKERFSPEFLAVNCFYTRRGGIDINPFRTSGHEWNSPYFLDDNVIKTIYQ